MSRSFSSACSSRDLETVIIAPPSAVPPRLPNAEAGVGDDAELQALAGLEADGVGPAAE